MDFSSLETVKVEFEGNGVTWVYMNRPEKMNAMNPKMSKEMLATLQALETDEETKVLILTGAGRSYCAGQDIKETFRERDEARFAGRLHPALSTDWRFDTLYYYQKPTIAMVNGWCCGGAFTHLFSCDLAVAAEEAQFCISEVNWGILPGGMVAKVVADGLSYRDAMYAILVAEPVDGKKAAEIGYVNFAVPLADLRKETLALADKILAKSPAVYKATKEAYKAVRSMDFVNSRLYLNTKSDQLRRSDPDRTYFQGMKGFLDDKSFKPGMVPVPLDENER